MKKVIIATLLSGAISVPAFAANGNDLADANLIFNMDNSQSMELAVLSSEEMKNTEGALGPWGAVGGGIIGGIGNIGYQLGSGNSWNWGSFGYAVGGGALTGFTGGAASWYVVPRVAFFGGFGAGRMGW
jgi:hypothetical protein